MNSLKKPPFHAPVESLLYFIQGHLCSFIHCFALWLREFHSSVIADRFQFLRQSKANDAMVLQNLSFSCYFWSSVRTNACEMPPCLSHFVAEADSVPPAHRWMLSKFFMLIAHLQSKTEDRLSNTFLLQFARKTIEEIFSKYQKLLRLHF